MTSLACSGRAALACAAFILALSSGAAFAAPLTDDRGVTIHSAAEVTARRETLITYLWGKEGFPTQLPMVVTNISSPVKKLDGLARVDEFRIDMAPGPEGLAYHFIPAKPNGEAVVVHHGHGCTLDDDPSAKDVGYGLQRTIAALLGNGYGVLGVFMPHMRPGDCTGAHDAMFNLKTTGSPMRFFLEPTAISLNYLKRQGSAGGFPAYRRFHMIGLSGGGWTTTVYAAIDPTISLSFPVAGTIPLYLRTGGSVGDREQTEPGFYSLAGYPDLYVMGAHGTGRKQVQILNRRDDCCFGEVQHDKKAANGLAYADAVNEYEKHVQTALKTAGGTFRVVIDETAPSHMISHHAVEKIILAELRGD